VPGYALDPDAIQSYIKIGQLKETKKKWPAGVWGWGCCGAELCRTVLCRAVLDSETSQEERHAHAQTHAHPCALPAHTTGVTMQLLTARPKSRGSVGLKSTDPFELAKVRRECSVAACVVASLASSAFIVLAGTCLEPTSFTRTHTHTLQKVDLGYFTDDGSDLATLVSGVKIARNIAAQVCVCVVCVSELCDVRLAGRLAIRPGRCVHSDQRAASVEA
jgi:hypothetical protein